MLPESWAEVCDSPVGVAHKFAVDVGPVNILELRVYCEGGFNHGSAAVWVDPLLKVK